VASAGRTRHSWRDATRLLPALAGAITILGLGVAAVRVGEGNLAQAEATRLASRRNLVAGAADHADMAIADGRVQDTVTSLLLEPGNPVVNDLMLGRFAAQHGGYPVSRVLLLRPDGTALASAPAGDSVPVTDFGPQWAEAVRGETARTSLFHVDDAPVTATLVPVGGRRPWGVIAAIQPALDSSLPAYYAGIGSLNDRPGGLTLVDRHGVAVASWDRSRIGAPVIGASDLGRLGREAVTWTTGAGDGAVTWVGTEVGGGYGLVYQQASEDLFGDLRDAQRQRDTTLLTVLACSLVALVVFQLWREQSARRSEARIRALLENTQDLVLVCDDAGGLVFVSPAISRLLGVPAEAWTGRALSSVCHPDDVRALTELLAAPGGRPPLDLRLAGAGDDVRWFDVVATDVRGVGELGAVLLTCRELGERKALQDELTFQATHDSLTGAVNRTELAARIEALLDDDRPRQPLAFLYLDLDDFKPVNDALGHEAGDRVLRAVVRRLTHAVGLAATVCRFGGDELGVLLPGADAAAALSACDRALDAIAQPIVLGRRSARVGASIGLALADPSRSVASPDELIRRADLAMYEAKRSGGGRVQIAAPLPPAEARPAPSRPAVTTPATVPRARPEPPVGPAIPATAGSAADGLYAPRNHRWTGLIALAVAAAAVTAVATTGYLQSQASQRSGQALRVAEVSEVAVHSAAYYATQTRFGRFAAMAEAMPFSFDGSPMDEAILRGWADASELGAGATVALATLDGQRLAAAPSRSAPRVGPDDPAWQQARAGKVAFVPFVADADQARSYVIVPVVKRGEVRAILLIGSSSRDGQVPQLLATGASPTAGGGWVLLDPAGRTFSASTPELIGTDLAAAGELAGLSPGESRARTGDDGSVLVVTPMPGFLAGHGYLAYWAPEGDLFADLQVGPASRGLGLGLLVACAVVGLALLNLRREQAVRRSESHLDALLQNSHDIIVVVGAEGRARFISSALERLLGMSADDLVGHSLLDLLHPDDRERVRALVMASDGSSPPARDVRVVDAHGDPHWFDIDATDLRTHPAVRGTLLTCHDITERRALQDQVAYQARRDPLTGLPNRASFEDRLDSLGRDGTAPFAVLFVDLDHFKPVNDRFGHHVGDEVLRVMAGRLTSAVRQHDVVCRLGGDEFAVVLADVTEGRARSTAERIVKLARDPVSVRGVTIRIGATVGIALSESGSPPQRAVRNADLAMYQAKQAGRGTYALFGHVR
jgi:diguanylate cyclase (GGDEF)-like protein/PAS domain S-box-containing protein